MKKLYFFVALLGASLATPVLAQNVQDRTDPQNPKDVTQASPAKQGATDTLKDDLKAQGATTSHGKESATADQSASQPQKQPLQTPQQQMKRNKNSNKE
jgi:hypothetical protein